MWFQFSQNVFIGTHTHTKTREKRRLGKQRKEKPKPEKHRKKREGGKPGRGPAFSACSGPPPPPRAHNVGTKPGLPGLWPEGAQPCRVAGDNSQVPEIPSPPGSIPSPAVLRPATYFWSIPAGQAPAGRAGRRPRTRAWWQRPLTRSTLTSTRPCQPPSQAATRLEPTALPAIPSPAPSHRPRAPPSAL